MTAAWQEAGGTFSGWIHSQGAVTAMTMGIGPGIGTILGPLIGQTLISIGGGMQLPPGVVMPPSGPTTVPSGGTVLDEDGKPLTQWQPGISADSKGNPGKPGDVWYGRWMSPEDAQYYVNIDIQNRQNDEAMFAQQRAKFEADWQNQIAKDRAEGARQIAEAAQRRAQEAAQAQYEQQLHDRMMAKLQQDPAMADKVNELVANKDWDSMEIAYMDKLYDQMSTGQKDAAYYNHVADAYGVAEDAAKLTVIASKGALIAMGNPAGMLVTATAVGTVSAAEQGSESYVRGDSASEVLTHTAVGFVSGAKDGAMGVYMNMPGVSTTAKILVPAAADTATTFVQLRVNNPNESYSDTLTKSLETGGISMVTNFAGTKIDGMSPGLLREGAQLGTAGVAGGVSSIVQGGDFGSGFIQGVEGGAAGRIGGALGGNAANYARSKTEQTVQIAIGEAQENKGRVIPIEEQAKIVQDLNDSRYPEGGKSYVDPEKALKQLQDTQSSRTAKQAPDEVKQAIIDTREDKIYGPANEATVNKATDTLDKAGLLQEGDKVKMVGFSTPGKGGEPSLGADRDAMVVIERTDPTTGKTVQVEVPRKYWEDDAYKDFYDHTTKIAGGPENITPQTQPEYYKRLEQLQYLKGSGMTNEQIQQRAWAEAHNQLFTDEFHLEASRDNSNQLTTFVGGKPVQTQQESNVLTTQHGDSTLLDPEGQAKMWHIKSEGYASVGNTPEAIAQSQKGIESYIKIRDGYHAQGYEVPPIDTRTAEAMEIITKSPVGVDATPDAMANVQKQLQNLGYHDVPDALGKIASQQEVLKWAQPRAQMSTGTTSMLGRENVAPPDSYDSPPPDAQY